MLFTIRWISNHHMLVYHWLCSQSCELIALSLWKLPSPNIREEKLNSFFSGLGSRGIYSLCSRAMTYHWDPSILKATRCSSFPCRIVEHHPDNQIRQQSLESCVQKCFIGLCCSPSHCQAHLPLDPLIPLVNFCFKFPHSGYLFLQCLSPLLISKFGFIYLKVSSA